MRVCARAHVRVSVYTFVCVCVCVCMFTHIRICIREFHVWSLNMSTFLCTVHVVVQTDDTKEVNRTVDRYTLN